MLIQLRRQVNCFDRDTLSVFVSWNLNNLFQFNRANLCTERDALEWEFRSRQPLFLLFTFTRFDVRTETLKAKIN